MSCVWALHQAFQFMAPEATPAPFSKDGNAQIYEFSSQRQQKQNPLHSK